jgi:hypothetical protein
MLTRTYTRTYNTVTFSDPYKKCCHCGQWIDGVLDKPEGPLIVVPCEHESAYRDLCSSWGPVDGCTCPDGSHERRPRPVWGDGHIY